MNTSYLAIDLGASSGRAILGTLRDSKIEAEEIYRFPTPVLNEGENLYWDIDKIWADIKRSIDLALERTKLRSISVDSWAVDYVPIRKDGSPVRNPFCYRDSRTAAFIEEVHTLVEPARLYSIAGIQFLPFNTIYQIYTDLQEEPDLVRETDSRILVGDYFNYLLSGEPVVEISNASTTGLVNAQSRQWSADLIAELGMDARRFPRIVESGTVFSGTDASRGVPVVCGLTHDTACAVAGIPAEPGAPFAYISSGTWSLIGTEVSRPNLSSEAFTESYTNELGLDGTVRFLKNMTGMWPLEECIREWRMQGLETSYETLMAAAINAGLTGSVINLDSPVIAEPGNMVAKVHAECEKSGRSKPENQGELVRLLMDSLAAGYKEKFGKLLDLAELPDDITLHIVGGGSRNELLNQLTADAIGVTVVAGPAESSALGNLLVQARSMNDLDPGMDIRTVVRRSSKLKTYLPGN